MKYTPRDLVAAVQAVPAWFWLVVITLVGVGLRIYDLGGESIWLDESYTYRRMVVSLPEMFADCYRCGQCPLYYMVARPWCSLAGYSEFAFLMHAVCADLDLYTLVFWPLDHGVYGSVSVCFRGGDVIDKLFRQMPPP